MKRIPLQILALLLSLALLLCGCGKDLPGSLDPAGRKPETSAPPESDTTEPALDPEPEPVPEPLPALEGLPLQLSGSVAELADAGDGRAVMIVNAPDPDAPQWDSDTLTIYLIDTVSAQVLAQRELSTSGEVSLAGVRRNGELVLRNFSTDRLEFYDSQLTPLRSVDLPDGYAAFDRDSDAIYCAENGRIERVSLSDMTRTPFFSGLGATFSTLDSARGRLLLLCRPAGDDDAWDYALYDVKENRTLLQGAEDWNGVNLAGDCLLLAGNYHWGEPENPEEESGVQRKRLDVYDPGTGTFDCGWILPGDASLYTDVGTSSVFAVTSPWSDGGDRQRFYLIDPLKGGVHELTAELNTPEFTQQICLRDDGTWLVAASSYLENAYVTELYLIRPAFTEMEMALEPAYQQSVSGVGHETGKLLQQLRERADRIEQTYGVRILLGDECLDMADNGSYTLISVTDESAYETEEDALNFTGSALDYVEQALAYYPEGFFRTFRDFRGEGGLRIALVAELENRYGDFMAGGIHYTSGAWYNIVLDADNLGTCQTVHHEMWHACESRVNDAGLETFHPDNWDALNPPDFAYTQDFETYYQRTDIDQYLMGWSEDPWFAQTYSTVTPMEDRSTLVETMLQDYYDPETYGYETSIAWVCSFPHLRAKVQAMHDAVEQVFGECYWEMP